MGRCRHQDDGDDHHQQLNECETAFHRTFLLRECLIADHYTIGYGSEVLPVLYQIVRKCQEFSANFLSGKDI